MDPKNFLDELDGLDEDEKKFFIEKEDEIRKMQAGRESNLEAHIQWLQEIGKNHPSILEIVNTAIQQIEELKAPCPYSIERQKKEIEVQLVLTDIGKNLCDFGDNQSQRIAEIMKAVMVPWAPPNI